MDITGNVFVAGGGSGIGKATCVALAKENASGILVVDIDLKSAEATVAEATAAISVNVSIEEPVKKAVARMVQSFGHIDYCVHCAGIHVHGTFLVTSQISAAMKTQELKQIDAANPQAGGTHRSIVNLGSVASLFAPHAVLAIYKTAAIDDASFGIRVNCISPTWVDTPMLYKTIGVTPGLDTKIILTADAVLFLCSPRSSFITRIALPADGDITISSST
ncbi:NAD(P)-binding protein [Annulohypoxylon bovei var. microspora]|nr:NAD(P)-binding protein [Annulohypoxylon bovei var. microspora]